MTEITIVGSEDNQGPKNFSKGFLTIPFEGSQFKDFISSLLGKPQSITKVHVGLFEMHLKDLQNFFDLINQRIVQQNNGQLIQFTTNIFFDDRSSVQLGSYEELVSYNEVKPIISKAVRLNWSYLIQFPDKQFSEKQVIEIYYSTGNMLIDNEDQPQFIFSSKRGRFITRIEHTARSWGFDLENVISNQIESLMRKESSYKKFIYSNDSRISIIASVIFFLIGVAGSFILTDSFINRELRSVKSYLNIKNHNINEKFDFLMSYIVSGIQPKFYFQIVLYLIIITVIAITLGIWVSFQAEEMKESSFLILTRKAKENRDQVLKEESNSWYILLFSLFGSILVGIVSNYIFKVLIE